MNAPICFSLGLAAALIPFVVVGDPATKDLDSNVVSIDETFVAPTDGTATVQTSVSASNTVTAPIPGGLTPVPPQPPMISLAPPVADVAKLAQAGVDESVMMAFVTNSPNTFNLSSDAIVYLNDIGVPSTVVNAMILHDQTLKENVSLVTTAPGQAYTPPPADTNSGSSAETPGTDNTASAQTEPTYVNTPPDLTDNSEAASEANSSYSYFYNSLAPYGAWTTVAGYGPCWRPTACALNPGWQPYCNSGHWVYTDCGWYWASDYSWGWAPFHYGRWFYAPQQGWCWAPGNVWSPAWVCWRYTPGYCGWAPLPPSAYYRSGVGFTYYGRSVGLSFGFGLQPGSFAFVPASRLSDPHLAQYRIASLNVVGIYNRSVPFNHFAEGQNHVVMNKGIPADRIAAATRTPIRAVALRDVSTADAARAGRWNGNAATLAVYRPSPQAPSHGVPTGGRAVGSFALHPVNPPNAVGNNGTVLAPANPVPVGRMGSALPIYRNAQPIQPSTSARAWSPAQGVPASRMNSAVPAPAANPQQPVPAPRPAVNWSQSRPVWNGTQLADSAPNRGYPAAPAAAAPPENRWANNPTPVHQTPYFYSQGQQAAPPVRAEPRQAPAQAAPAVPQRGGFTGQQPARSVQQQQSAQQFNGVRR